MSKIAAALNGWRKTAARASCGIIKTWTKEEERPMARPEISVVHETFVHKSSAVGSTLRRKRASQDLREESKRSSEVVHEHDAPDCPASNDEPEELEGSTDGNYTEDINEAERTNQQYHALGYPPDEGEILTVQYVAVRRIPRSRVQRRPRGLIVDTTNAMADVDGLDTAVSPTNTNRPFHTPPQSQRQMMDHVSFKADEQGVNRYGLRRTSGVSLDHRRSTVASSFMESQERFDSYIDAINDEEAKRCSMHAVLSTDIARLVAELDVLHNRITMANMRSEYHRRATLNAAHTRPESWTVGSAPISRTCSCGKRFELSPEQNKAKRQTWQAGQPPTTTSRSRSRKSETEQEVMLRNSAGTNLFRRSLYGGQEECGRPPAQENEMPVPQVELSKSFDFRRECERVARRIRPTFAILRA